MPLVTSRSDGVYVYLAVDSTGLISVSVGRGLKIIDAMTVCESRVPGHQYRRHKPLNGVSGKQRNLRRLCGRPGSARSGRVNRGGLSCRHLADLLAIPAAPGLRDGR